MGVVISIQPIAQELSKGDRLQGTELTSADVGRLLSYGGGFGLVRHFDVGKRVWYKPYGLVMENNAQRDRRKRRST